MGKTQAFCRARDTLALPLVIFTKVAYRLLFAILALTGKHCILFFFIFDKSVLFSPRFFYAKFLPFSPYFHNLRHIARIFGKFFAIHNQKLSFP